MRQAVGLLVGLVLLAGCAETKGWPYALVVQSPPDITNCGEQKQPPLLAGVRAHGLEGPHFWLPGQAIKVNWMSEPPGAVQEMRLTLHRPGEEAPAYQLELAPRPSLISFPTAGCWDLSVNGAAPVRVAVQAAQLKGLAASAGSDPDAPGARVVEWPEPQAVIDVLNAAAYYPAAGDEQALLAIQKSLLTNDCRDAAIAVGVRLKPETARKLESKLGNGMQVSMNGVNPLRQISTACDPFRPVP